MVDKVETVTDAEAANPAGLQNLWSQVENKLQEAVKQEASEEDEDESEEDTEDEDESDEEIEDETNEEEDEEDEDEESDEEDESDEDEEESEEGTEEKPEPVLVKSYKAKLDDGTELEIPDNAVFKLKENGKFRTVTFKELKNARAGEVAWDEKLKSLNEKKKELDSKLVSEAQQTQLLKDAAKYIDEGDMGPAIEALGESLGLEPGKFFDTWVQAFNIFFSDLIKQDEPTRAATVAHAKFKAIKSRTDREINKHNQRTKQTEFERDMKEFAKEHSIAEEELELCAGEILKRHEKDPSKVSAKEIKELACNRKIVRNFLAEANKIGIELSKDDQLNLWEVVVKNDPQANRFEPEDYNEILSEYAKVMKLKGTSNRKAKKKATPKKELKKPKKEALSLNDIWR